MNSNAKGEQDTQEPQASVRAHLERLQKMTDADFVAMALYDPEQGELRWRVAYGSLNERYKAIAIRVGKGVAGEVLLTGRPMSINAFPDDLPAEPLEYPIMFVEKLVSCYAVPIGENGVYFGVILLGDRSGRTFGQTDKDAAERVSKSVHKLYTPSYESAVIKRDRPLPVKSPLMAYLQRNMSHPAGLAGAEILDQRITRIPESLQVEMTQWLDRLMESLVRDTDERMRISVERKEGSWMSLEATVPRRLDHPQEQLSWLFDRIGELRGNVEMYNEPGKFNVRINLPIGLMAEDTPWSYK